MNFRNLLILSSLIILGWQCSNPTDKNQNQTNLIRLNGKTMGSGYNVSYRDSLNRNFQPQIDSFLQELNRQVSTYDSSSIISQLNTNKLLAWSNTENSHLTALLLISKQIYTNTNGYFNPAVKPLVNYWGFGYKTKKPIETADPKVVDSLLQIVDFQKISIDSNSKDSIFIRKTEPRTQVEFNAIAPGYAADKIAEWLMEKGINDFLVEIGGEIRAKGKSSAQFGWKVGINRPSPDAGLEELQAVVELNDISLATSGNYRSFYEKDGKKYVHTINPKTGYTEQNSLLSASVFAPTAAEADAYATSFMAMGLEKSSELIPKLTSLKVFLIFVDEKGEISERYINGAEKLFVE